MHDLLLDGFVHRHEPEELLEGLLPGGRLCLHHRGAEFTDPAVLVEEQVDDVAGTGRGFLTHRSPSVRSVAASRERCIDDSLASSLIRT
jgi:hypothetical protein